MREDRQKKLLIIAHLDAPGHDGVKNVAVRFNSQRHTRRELAQPAQLSTTKTGVRSSWSQQL
jgi:hypothetical protein